MKRQRATVIVEIEERIVFVENHGGMVLLPGGGIQPGESRLHAAARELAEETGLVAESMLYLFAHESQTNCHHVFWALATGTPLAADDARALHLGASAEPTLYDRMSQATREIVGRFAGLRARHPASFAAAQWTAALDRGPGQGPAGGL